MSDSTSLTNSVAATTTVVGGFGLLGKMWSLFEKKQEPAKQQSSTLQGNSVTTPADDVAGMPEDEVGTGVRGRSGFELKNSPNQPLRNTPTTIGQREYTGHALDQMQNRGVMPSVVENTIKTGSPFATREGTVGYHDAVNNIRAIVSTDTGRVVAVIRGAP